MSDKPKMSVVDKVIIASVSLSMLAAVYELYVLFSEDDSAKLGALRMISSACKKTASTIGGWGLKSEVAYNRIIEAGRMN